MELSVSSLLNAPQAVTHLAFSDRFALDGDDEKLTGPVTGSTTITRVGQTLLQVEGSYEAPVELTCDRCGNRFTFTHAFRLEEPLTIAEDVPKTHEVDEAVAADGTLDLSDLVRQALVLSLPPRRLCGCEPPATSEHEVKTDPRWEALKALASPSTDPS